MCSRSFVVTSVLIETWWNVNDGAINRYIYWQGSTLDQDINPDELRKLILCPHWVENPIGATRVIITKPEYKELPSTTVAKFSGKINVQHVVKD